MLIFQIQGKEAITTSVAQFFIAFIFVLSLKKKIFLEMSLWKSVFIIANGKSFMSINY